MADSNFNADHVRQKAEGTDIWLSEGGGMTSVRKDYEDFLRTAEERLTVSDKVCLPGGIVSRRH